MSILGLITARGGSKGTPGKNVKTIAGKPLIAWTIEAALESSLLDRVIVSTDDDNIALVSRQFGAEVPFMRPVNLAQDDSPHIDVLIHAIEWIRDEQGYNPEYLMLLQPTSPLRTVDDINNAVGLANKHDADCVIGVSLSPVHPYLIKQVDEKGKLESYTSIPDGYLPRQVYPTVYYENGAIYLIKTETVLKKGASYLEDAFPYVMPIERSLDIDTPWDFHVGNLILQDKHK